MKGVIYARYSSDNQREESIEGQIRENTAYAEKNGITIVGHYIDRALSAKTDNRPEFQRMIRDSAKKNFDVVIVWKLDRFSRNRYDSAKYKAMLKKNNVRVISATESISEGAEGIILESVLEGMAEYYSADLAEKVKRGMTENALKCRFNGSAIPFGYSVDEEKHYQLNPVTAPVVLEIFQKYADGMSIKDITDELNARGLKTAKGVDFNKNSLRHMFKNRIYIGEYKYSDIVIPNGIPAIVPLELFDRVNERMQKNKHASAKNKATEPYILTTKLFCGDCKTMFVGDSAKKKDGTYYRYYKCAASKRHECKMKAVRKEWIEDFVIENLVLFIFDDEAVSRIADDVIALLNKENVVVPALKSQLSEVRKAIDNILKAIEMGIITRSTKERLEELEAEEERLKANIEAEEYSSPKLTKEQIVFTLTKFRTLDMRVTKNRERLVDALVKSILIYNDRVVFYLTYKDEPVEIPTRDEIIDSEKSSDIKVNGSPASNLANGFIKPFARFLFFGKMPVVLYLFFIAKQKGSRRCSKSSISVTAEVLIFEKPHFRAEVTTLSALFCCRS